MVTFAQQLHNYGVLAWIVHLPGVLLQWQQALWTRCANVVLLGCSKSHETTQRHDYALLDRCVRISPIDADGARNSRAPHQKRNAWLQLIRKLQEQGLQGKAYECNNAP